MNSIVKNIITSSLILFSISLIGKENVYNPGATNVVYTKVAAGCAPSTSQTELDVNNVRTIILASGDMWWNLEDARYEIPKGSNRHSLFAGALWIGGVDAGGQIKVAAMTYRQSAGHDFWTGPLNTETATITEDECNKWDKHFKISRAEVEEFIDRYGTDGTDPTYTIPSSIIEWPAHGDEALGQDEFIAPFFDLNGNGLYEPTQGDYPDYNVTGTNDQARLFGDQTLFWVFNDKGNVHTESNAEPLGLEIHAQAFGFTADNEVNDMTFYNYKIINRSTLPLNDTYFGQWVDPDLGNYLDDYVGCDVALGLGFCYNGDAEDEGGSGYGFNPPAIGVDFFQGPLADPNDGIDNDRDGTIDELGEEIIMSKFVYYNNDFTVIGNPSEGIHFYNYLRGIWKDNVPMTWGGDGHGSGQGSTNEECNFMFPGTSDSDFPGQEWTEVTANNIPADRRFLQSAGPFTLQPGAVNEITTGVVWARAKSGGQTASVQLVKIYDREAQALFDNNFNIINGPDAPDLTITELDKELIFTLSNSTASNNYNETYSEKDPYITKPFNLANNPNYEFQGYLVYQLKDATVSQNDLDDPDRARLVFRSDIRDTVTGIVNQYLDPILGVFTPVEEVSSVLSQGVIGSVDEGVQFSFKLTDDKFALGNTRFVNHKTYYFMTLAYAYNRGEENADPYDVNAADYDGRNQPYIAGRRNIKIYSGIPHINDPENGGTVLNAQYGDGVSMTRSEGSGNGGNALHLTEETINEILSSTDHRSFDVTYEAGSSPVDISVVDPLNIPGGDYTIKFEDPEELVSAGIKEIISYGKWSVINDENGRVLAKSNKSLVAGTEQYIKSLGLSIKIKQINNPGVDPLGDASNGLISSSLEFEDPYNAWLTGVPDRDDENGRYWGLNWIRAGSYDSEDGANFDDYSIDKDPNAVYETIIEETKSFPGIFGEITASGGTWTAYNFASNYKDGPGYNGSTTNQAKTTKLHSVDIVFTNNTDHWTKCVVVEAQEDPNLSIGGQVKMGLRQSPSVDKLGNDDGSGTMGMGWFPGYAINIETGERLNIIFAEDSYQKSENGDDMIWNPTSNIVTDEFPYYSPNTEQFNGGSYLFGGKHFIYILQGESWVKGTQEYLNEPTSQDRVPPNYDEGAWVYNKLNNDVTGAGRATVFKNISWVGIPLLKQGLEYDNSLLANKATVKIRVAKPYRNYETVDPFNIFTKDDPLVVNQTYLVAHANEKDTWGGKEIIHDGTTYNPGEYFIATNTSFEGTGQNNARARVIKGNSVNSYNPIYKFNTDDIKPEEGNNDIAKSALEKINVVPNPYYGYSSYETNQLDNRIKITNLPQRATISIFTVSGTLVRKIKKDDSVTSIDWDLKNDYGIPIASGLYVIHVDAKGVGEKVVKWFGVLRPIDLDTF